jgi:hypothetical protein
VSKKAGFPVRDILWKKCPIDEDLFEALPNEVELEAIQHSVQYTEETVEVIESNANNILQ